MVNFRAKKVLQKNSFHPNRFFNINRYEVKATISFILLIILLISVSGCKSEDPNPELSDPIYKKLLEQVGLLKTQYESEQKKIEDLERDLEKSKVISAERIKIKKDLMSSRKKMEILAQQRQFFEIRSEHRRVEARKKYKIAFSKGIPWPDPKEIEYFLTNQNLQLSSRNWNTRVPKLHDRLLSQNGSHKEKKKPSEGKETEKKH